MMPVVRALCRRRGAVGGLLRTGTEHGEAVQPPPSAESLYLATPLLRILTRHASRRDLIYLLAVWFAGTCVLPIFTRFTGIDVGIEIMVATKFVGLFVLGHWLKPILLDRRGMRIPAVVMVIAGSFTMLATHAMTVAANGTFDNFWMLDWGLTIVVLASAMFLFLKSIDWDALFATLPPLRFGVMVISSNSLGI